MIAADPESQACTFSFTQTRQCHGGTGQAERPVHASDSVSIVNHCVDEVLAAVLDQIDHQRPTDGTQIYTPPAQILKLLDDIPDYKDDSTTKFDFDPTLQPMTFYTIDDEAKITDSTINCVKYKIGDGDTLVTLLEALYHFEDLADTMAEDCPVYPFFTASTPSHLRLFRKLMMHYPTVFYNVHSNVEVVLFQHLENDMDFTSWHPSDESHGEKNDIRAYLEDYFSALSDVYTDIDVVLTFKAFLRDFDYCRRWWMSMVYTCILMDVHSRTIWRVVVTTSF